MTYEETYEEKEQAMLRRIRRQKKRLEPATPVWQETTRKADGKLITFYLYPNGQHGILEEI